MRIGCLCITENRAPIIGIALASYRVASKTLRDNHGTSCDSVLLVQDASAGDATRNVLLHCHVPTVYQNTYGGPRVDVATRVERGCRVLFDHYGCDYVTMWDDDDYAPHDRLAAIYNSVVNTEKPGNDVYAYTRGWFVNLRTLHGEWITAEYGWGGSLTFSRNTALACGGFVGRNFPGYDREFTKECQAHGGRLLDLARCSTLAAAIPLLVDPVAFSHGKNCATWLNSSGQDVAFMLETRLPDEVWQAVKSAQKFLVDHRVFPPQPE